MDEAYLSRLYWDGGSEAQRRLPVAQGNSAPAADMLPEFTFSADSGFPSAIATPFIDVTHFGHPTPLLPTDFPGASQRAFHSDFSAADSWDAASLSLLPQRPSTHLQPTPARAPSTDSSSAGDFFHDDSSDEYSSSRFSSAPPSSIPEDDGWSSRGWSSNNSRPVSAAPSSVYGDLDHNRPPWGGAFDGPPSEMVPLREPNVNLVGEAPDMDARLDWDWKPSGVTWLDPDVSSEVVKFPDGIQLTDKQKIYALHRVKGCPSQFPFYQTRTAFLVDLTDMQGLDSEMTVDSIIRDQDSHSFGGSSGARNNVDAYLPGSFFGLSNEVRIATRRATPKCVGVSACESLDPAFLSQERRELDPEPSRKLGAAMLHTREMQDNTDVGRTLAFHHSLQSWHYNGVRADGQRCDGSISLRKLNVPDRNKTHILLCSKRTNTLMVGLFHSQTRILDHVMNGERIIDNDDSQSTWSRVVSGRTGGKGKAICPFNHHKDGLPYVAKIQPVTCVAKMHIYCPWETLHPELARMAVVVPSSESGHTHPPPPKKKCTQAIAERYRECVRKIGLGATIVKVENAQSTKELLDGKTPSLSIPTRLIQQVKAELNDSASSAANTTTRQQVAAYIADQEALSDDKRYLHSSMSRDGKRVIFGAHHKLLCSIHDLRTLDCDTTFKPVAGEMQIFEINGWLVEINESVTVMRVWMEVHDRKAYKSVWDEVQRLVLKLTGKPLKFLGLHRGGRILGLNSDMEAAPLLRLADSFAPTVDLEDVRPVVMADPQELLAYILQLCYSHFNRAIPDLLNLTDPQGVLKRWWEHKLMHCWLLRGIIQCLSNIPLERWNTMEATTNLGEAQHAWNNAQTGISMGVIESFKNPTRGWRRARNGRDCSVTDTFAFRFAGPRAHACRGWFGCYGFTSCVERYPEEFKQRYKKNHQRYLQYIAQSVDS
ncbi:hypothetical protein B0H17DRAFT_1040862 [Mycena rosella]|uniref:Uncharacterized protein n=1 Tax=Mycena rosella TaxID=1033263 RepID=A0AAD7M6F1_MYCRO|nr:hypothetical protein B0H17DRAFT_1040862 [Mycena rosella]